eukprot:9503633-Pyramimonas_sp.AAC.2
MGHGPWAMPSRRARAPHGDRQRCPLYDTGKSPCWLGVRGESLAVVERISKCTPSGRARAAWGSASRLQ